MTWKTDRHGTPAPYERWYPCIALRTRGRIGHMWVFKSYRAAFKIPNVDYPRNPYRFRQGGHPGMIVTHWYYPYNMKTAEQQAWRQGMINAASYWQGFDSGTKSYYNEFAKNRPISGYTRYIQLYLRGYIPIQIAFDFSSSIENQDSTPVSWSHTCSGNNRVLVVGVSYVAYQTIVSVKYNGVDLSHIRTDTGGGFSSDLWYLIAPATGAHNIEVTFSGSDYLWWAAGAISLTGVKQTDQPDAHNGKFGVVADDGQPSVSVNTVANNSWIIDNVVSLSAALGDPSAGQSKRYGNLIFTGIGICAGSTKGPVSPAGATNMGWSGVADFGTWNISAVSFKPV